jgi:adenylate cyclase
MGTGVASTTDDAAFPKDGKTLRDHGYQKGKEMAEEPERRFLLADGFDPSAYSHETITQSYLQDTGSWVIRVRETLHEDGTRTHVLTLKRARTDVTNTEHEPAITEELYLDMLNDTGAEIVKARHRIRHGAHVWEVDVYADERVRPRMIAEVELAYEGEPLEIPDWAVEEVTGDRWYSNAQIAARLDAMDGGE